MLDTIAELYKVMCEDGDDVHSQITSELSNLILKSFMLGRRLGISYLAMETEVENKLRIGILKEEQLEKDFKDYSGLLHYLKSRKM